MLIYQQFEPYTIDLTESFLYQVNEELKEATIGAEYGVSRTPVREALRQLELEGLVKIIPNKGAYVTGISDKDTRDIYVIRSYLVKTPSEYEKSH